MKQPSHNAVATYPPRRYPLPSLAPLVIVAAGNHFFLDAAAYALVAGLAALLIRRPATTWLAALLSAARSESSS
jgi:hypothetical protein